MPQLVAFAVVGAGLYAGYRWLSRIVNDATARLRQAEEEMARKAAAATMGEPRDLGRLELDPQSGVYRPSRRD